MVGYHCCEMSIELGYDPTWSTKARKHGWSLTKEFANKPFYSKQLVASTAVPDREHQCTTNLRERKS